MKDEGITGGPGSLSTGNRLHFRPNRFPLSGNPGVFPSIRATGGSSLQWSAAPG